MFYTYIVTNRPRGVLYTGQTDDINRRAWEHRTHSIKGTFTDRYNCEVLVWYESFDTRDEARAREQQIKNWRRLWKIELIENTNPGWQDLADTLL
ncbi:MAG: GIY-YIG nuclease family protein [Pseudomonadota bacterium]